MKNLDCEESDGNECDRFLDCYKAHASQQDGLQAAKLLADNNLHDIAVSRAYYTMFYVVQAF